MSLSLDTKDRLLLVNQYTILASLYPDDADHYHELAEIARAGYEVLYSELGQWIPEPMPLDKSRFVFCVLGIYRAIEDHKRANPAGPVASHDYCCFRGFSGNDEGVYLSFAKFLVTRQGKFGEQKAYFSQNDGMNSHFPMVETYRRMVEVWTELGEPVTPSEEQALQILDAAARP